MVGTNFNFCVPCLVTSDGFLARLPIAFVCEAGREFEPEAAPSPEDIGRVSLMPPKRRSLQFDHISRLLLLHRLPAKYFYSLFQLTMAAPTHVRATYNDIHNLIKASAHKIGEEFKPNMLIAIGVYKAHKKFSGNR